MTYATNAMDMLADPTRRRILEKLRQGPCAVGAIAANLPVSRPAVSQHLKLLRETGLVAERRVGTRRYYALSPEGLGELRAYIDGLWSDALNAFAAHVAKGSPEKDLGDE